jgi:hypothetical protein
MDETPDAPAAPNGKRRGADPERMRELTRMRMEMAETDPSKKGGRPRTRFTKAEAEERALEKMLPKALAVLNIQLDSVDERVRQSAAVKVLEYVKGKPVQQIQQQVAQITEIRYETAAWMPTLDVESNSITPSHTPELPSG